MLRRILRPVLLLLIGAMLSLLGLTAIEGLAKRNGR